MYDMWVEAISEGKWAAAAMIDMSAAFDTVDIDILLEKCKLYNFGTDIIELLKSYLTERRQLVTIDGKYSSTLPLEAGVPQGSILGPILYTLYTNDFPEVIHRKSCKEGTVEGGSIRFRTACKSCGAMVCFADDSTYTIIAEDIGELSINLEEQFTKIAGYLGFQRLSVNQDKTHLLLLTTWQRRQHLTEELRLRAGAEDIETTERESLLGIELEQNMGFGKHIENTKDKVKTGIKALKAVSRIASFKTRKNLMMGLINSKLTYMMTLWGGCPNYMIIQLQKLQNEALRLVTQKKWEIIGVKKMSTKRLLLETGQLSINQMVAYYSILNVRKIITNKEPEYLSTKIMRNSVTHDHGTRANTGTNLRMEDTKLGIAKNSFRWRATEIYNKMPRALKEGASTRSVKMDIKVWVSKYVPVNVSATEINKD